jgi:ABC-2 type transport system permease protein
MVKEFIQMRRDRLTFAMIIGVPLLQLVLFGYAINTDPSICRRRRSSRDHGPISRAILSPACSSPAISTFVAGGRARRGPRMLARGEVSFIVTIPAGFERRLRARRSAAAPGRGRRHRPDGASNGGRRAPRSCAALAMARPATGARSLAAGALPVDVIVHRLYNPEGITAYNIVPGLLGTILTMTLVLMTGAGAHPRGRARHHGEPAGDAGAPARDHDRQDRALYRLRAWSRWR